MGRQPMPSTEEEERAGMCSQVSDSGWLRAMQSQEIKSVEVANAYVCHQMAPRKSLNDFQSVSKLPPLLVQGYRKANTGINRNRTCRGRKALKVYLRFSCTRRERKTKPKLT